MPFCRLYSCVLCAMKNDNKRIWAQELFVKMGLPQKDIAERVQVTEKTIGNWKLKYEWDLLRAAEVTTSENTVRSIYSQISKITRAADEEKRVLTVSESDMISKLAASAQKLQNKATLTFYVEVMEQFVNYLKNVDLELAKVVVVHQYEFIRKECDR